MTVSVVLFIFQYVFVTGFIAVFIMFVGLLASLKIDADDIQRDLHDDNHNPNSD